MRRTSMVTCGAAVLAVIAAGGVMGCATSQPMTAATPPALAAFGDDGPVTTPTDWTERRAPILRDVFQDEIYGRLPERGLLTVEEHTVVDADAFNGAGRIEQVVLTMDDPALRFAVALAIPRGDGPHPVIIQLTFCGNRAAFGGRADITAPFGAYAQFCDRIADAPSPETPDAPDTYLRAPPLETIVRRGYAVATFFTGDIIPDDREAAIAALEALAPSQDPEHRLGAIAAWGWGASVVIDYLETDPTFDPNAMAVLGHSRNGKAAFAAAMFDSRIDLVIAHQSGTGGATLSRSYEGEAVENITGGFPHWFAPAFRGYAGAEDALPVDQHLALALIAPRPVFLGAAIDDTWAGPEGAWLAAHGADPVYELFGGPGLDQTSREEPNYQADIAYVLRPGRHGTTRSDWEHFLAFLDAHFGPHAELTQD